MASNIKLVGLGTFDPACQADFEELKKAAKGLKAVPAGFFLAEEGQAKPVGAYADRLALLSKAAQDWGLKVFTSLEDLKGDDWDFYLPSDEVSSLEALAKRLQIPKEKIYTLDSFKGEPFDLASQLNRAEIRAGRDYRMPLDEGLFLVENKLYKAADIAPLHKPRRYAHVISVARLSYRIAEANKLDPYLAFEAGYLHDVCRMEAKKEYNKAAEAQYGKYFKGEMPSWAYHQFTGPMYLKDELGITNELVLDAIRYHSTGKKDMSWLGKILYAADKIEPLRGYDSASLIAAMEKDVDSGFIAVLKANTDFLEGKVGPSGIQDELTVECMQCYLKGNR
jgi:predicted HD superfamily hydrolase involved in NAD metabolism